MYNLPSMDQIARNSLKKALDLVREGKYDQARPILIELLKQHPNVEQAWFLLSFTVPEDDRKIYALEQALKAKPDYPRARDRLAKLRGELIDTDDGMDRAFEKQAPEPEPVARPEPTPIPGPDFGSEPEPIPTPAFFDEGEMDFDEDNQAWDEGAEPSPWRRRLRLLGLVLLFIVVVTLAYVFGGDWLAQQLSDISLARQPAATATEIVAFRELPPTWTPMAADQTPATPTPTQIPSPTPTPQAFNFPAPDAQVLASMDVIQAEVEALRRLPAVQLERFIISQPDAATLLTQQYLDGERSDALAQEARVLAALGLIPVDYSLADYALSRWADQAGGFYLPDPEAIFLVGADFSGLAPFFYAHAFQHASIQGQFGLETTLLEGGCPILSDACRAAMALIEGDASVIAEQWLTNFASPETQAAAEDYDTAQMLVQNQEPPAFVLLDLAFPYAQGSSFVQALLDAGSLDRLDQAYEQPPFTTEQILHPESYLTPPTETALGGAAAPLEAVELPAELAGDWQTVPGDSLGEWLTYLLLAQGANEAARLPDELAATASTGWGDDVLQAYTRGDGAVLLSAYYAWDTETDADEWQGAMQDYLDARLEVTGEDLEGGECWQAEGQAACLWQAGERTLWLLGPDTDVLVAWQAQFTDFQ